MWFASKAILWRTYSVDASIYGAPQELSNSSGPCDYLSDSIIARQTNGVLALYAEKVRDISKVCEIGLVDIHREWMRMSEDGLDTDVWLSNGLNHPDSRGHALAASCVFHVLLTCRDDSTVS